MAIAHVEILRIWGNRERRFFQPEIIVIDGRQKVSSEAVA